MSLPAAWERFDTDTGTNGEALANLYFDEAWYLARYPAVRAAVAAGAFPSGYAHFRAHGHEDLSPHWLFDPVRYREQIQHHTGRALDRERDGDPYDHFLRRGQHQGLSGHALFDPGVYSTRAPFDIAWRIARDGPFTTLLRELAAGGEEPTASLHFDPDWYRTTYPEAAAAIAAGDYRAALHHYLANPEPTRFDPSPRFSERAYLVSVPELVAAIAAAAFRNGFDHFLRHGRAEGRFYAPSGANPFAAEPTGRPPASTRFALRRQVFERVTLTPCAADPKRPGMVRFGVFDRDGAMINAFRHPWLTLDPERPGTATSVAGDHVYGGVMLHHFGHMLRDVLAGLWFMRRHPDLPVLWNQVGLPVPHDLWPNRLAELWALLGLDRLHHQRIDAPIAVERLVLPEPGLLAPNVLHPLQAAALAVRHCAAPATDARVWLSRRALPERFGRFAGEDMVEARLAARGWTVICPEQQPVVAQADLFATAAVVAGTISSAFHAVLLSANPRAALILVHRPGVPHGFYDAVARVRSLRQTHLAAALRPFQESHTRANFALADPPGLADAICAAADSAAPGGAAANGA